MAQKQGGGGFSHRLLQVCPILRTKLTYVEDKICKSVTVKTDIDNVMGLEVINPEGGTEDAEVEAQKGDGNKRCIIDFVFLFRVSIAFVLFELMEYSYLLKLADECEDPYLRLVYADVGKQVDQAQAGGWANLYVLHVFPSIKNAILIDLVSYEWIEIAKHPGLYPIIMLCNVPGKPFNPILGETYEMVCHHPPISAAHAENEHFVYDITSKVKTKFLATHLMYILLEEPKILMTGKWNTSMSYQPCDWMGSPFQELTLKR
ncbi:hypothetical protein E3N88_44814 [Mikania micrantha]|uniref:Uncharacterized protein n=1 Tax=Mikania micrantha TaxID=192012 RepID=A0A5N6LB85_9ASTR|nr:hypothetical protein E3N88_44814 [Mikania micrantha]